MKKIAPIFIIIAAALGYLIFSSPGLRPAPAITMTSLAGKTLDTVKRNSKPLLVTFWATTCVSCVKEMPHLVDLQNRLGDRLDITGVSMYYDNIEHVKEMIDRKKLNYNIVTDRGGKIAEAFGGIRLTPTSFLISPDGQIVYQKIGDVDFKKIEKDIQQMNLKEKKRAVG